MHKSNRYRALTPKEEWIMLHKGTEEPHSGEYNDCFLNGIYKCKRCLRPLYRSDSKLPSKLCWPSFNAALQGAIKKTRSHNNDNTEIACATCGGHLGHMCNSGDFSKNHPLHCINSTSLLFEYVKPN